MEAYIRGEVQREGIAEYSRSVIGLTREILRDRNPEEMERFISIYSILMEYPGAPVGNLRCERRLMVEELTGITIAQPTHGRPRRRARQ